MPTIYKISEDISMDAVSLIAIHSNLEDYALAYSINQCFKSNFKRTRTDLEISKDVSFPIFEWKDSISDECRTLITNKKVIMESLNEDGLFKNEPLYIRHYLIPEYKDVDYFLRIELETIEEEKDIIKLILTIPKVITAYTVETTELKSKNNLIF